MLGVVIYYKRYRQHFLAEDIITNYWFLSVRNLPSLLTEGDVFYIITTT